MFERKKTASAILNTLFLAGCAKNVSLSNVRTQENSERHINTLFLAGCAKNVSLSNVRAQENSKRRIKLQTDQTFFLEIPPFFHRKLHFCIHVFLVFITNVTKM
jgi:PBP1b-binding outer membrane lipoprotein LpoB